jgi:hypothetical protein
LLDDRYPASISRTAKLEESQGRVPTGLGNA